MRYNSHFLALLVGKPHATLLAELKHFCKNASAQLHLDIQVHYSDSNCKKVKYITLLEKALIEFSKVGNYPEIIHYCTEYGLKQYFLPKGKRFTQNYKDNTLLPLREQQRETIMLANSITQWENAHNVPNSGDIIAHYCDVLLEKNLGFKNFIGTRQRLEQLFTNNGYTTTLMPVTSMFEQTVSVEVEYEVGLKLLTRAGVQVNRTLTREGDWVGSKLEFGRILFKATSEDTCTLTLGLKSLPDQPMPNTVMRVLANAFYTDYSDDGLSFLVFNMKNQFNFSRYVKNLQEYKLFDLVCTPQKVRHVDTWYKESKEIPYAQDSCFGIDNYFIIFVHPNHRSNYFSHLYIYTFDLLEVKL